jgi:hypothetical protein
LVFAIAVQSQELLLVYVLTALAVAIKAPKRALVV